MTSGEILRALENQVHDTKIDPSWAYQFEKESYMLALAQAEGERTLWHARKYLEDPDLYRLRKYLGGA